MHNGCAAACSSAACVMDRRPPLPIMHDPPLALGPWVGRYSCRPGLHLPSTATWRTRTPHSVAALYTTSWPLQHSATRHACTLMGFSARGWSLMPGACSAQRSQRACMGCAWHASCTLVGSLLPSCWLVTTRFERERALSSHNDGITDEHALSACGQGPGSS